MFGGWGLYTEGRMFALIAEGQLYFKVDEETRESFMGAQRGGGSRACGGKEACLGCAQEASSRAPLKRVDQNDSGASTPLRCAQSERGFPLALSLSKGHFSIALQPERGLAVRGELAEPHSERPSQPERGSFTPLPEAGELLSSSSSVACGWMREVSSKRTSSPAMPSSAI
jgi:hypothetical protein